MKNRGFIVFGLVWMLAFTGCAPTSIRLFSDAADPLQEFVLEGSARQKIAVIPIHGFISSQPDRGMIRTRPSMVQEVVAHLRRAEADPDVQAVLLNINSPGGTVTASDILYSEIKAFQTRKSVPIVALMMDMAASGGYYVALPADRIVAHPTSITGSVGVIFMRPNIAGLMDKIGVRVTVDKSGDLKDMGSPYGPASPEARRLFENLTRQLGQRFIDRVVEHRQIEPPALDDVATARIYLAPGALEMGLVDRIGYAPDALADLREMAKLTEDCRVVVYRRSRHHNDTIYNPVTSDARRSLPSAILPGGTGWAMEGAGFYYLWPSAVP